VSGVSKRQLILQLATAFAVMLIVKAVADRYEVIGAGSIAIWCAILTATIFMRRNGLTWRGFGLLLPKGRGQWLRQFGWGILAMVAVFLLMGLVLAPLFGALGLESPAESNDRFTFFLGKPVQFVGFLVVVIWFGAALGEEMFMRGFVLNRLATFLGEGKIGWAAALVIHATIFGAMHAYQGVPGMIGTGLIGLVLGVFYLVGKRMLFPVVLAHGLVNTIGLLGFYFTDGALT